MNHGPDRTNNTSLRNMDTEALRSLLMMELSAEGDLNIEKIQEITDIIADGNIEYGIYAYWNKNVEKYEGKKAFVHFLKKQCPKDK